MKQNKMMLTMVIAAAVIIAGLGAYVAFVLPEASLDSDNTANLQIAASVYPLAHMTEEIAKGGSVTVKTIVPPGTEPHDFEPSAQDVAQVYQSDAFLYSGGAMDPWARDVAKNLEASESPVLAVPMQLNLFSQNQKEGTLLSHDAQEEELYQRDPHYWLDPVIAQQMVSVILHLLITIDANHTQLYTQNAEAYTAQLQALDTEYQTGLQACQQVQMIFSHDAFAYLGDRYSIERVYILGISPEEEPSAKHIADLVDIAKKNKIKYIFFETLVSSKLAETIATEVGAQTLVLNPFEGLTEEEIAAGKTYVSVMRENLQNLRIGMECQ